MTPPVALTIAGSDSGAGAGIQADLRTFAALGVHGTSAIAAITAQNTAEVRTIVPVDAQLVEEQVLAVVEDMEVRAVKTGMLATSANVDAVAHLAATGVLPNLVVDPVLAASTGRRLVDDEAVSAYREALFPSARLVTPNLGEAAIILGRDPRSLDSLQSMFDAASELVALGASAALVKGGHLAGGNSPDVLLERNMARPLLLEQPRIVTTNDHGSGCTLSAAITAWLAVGAPLEDAVRAAKSFVTMALAGSASWQLGNGHGPLDQLGWGSGAERAAAAAREGPQEGLVT